MIRPSFWYDTKNNSLTMYIVNELCFVSFRIDASILFFFLSYSKRFVNFYKTLINNGLCVCYFFRHV